ncbi:MAG: hypothetical protein QF442_00885, partial [Candidatus Peribacteraceae bacterium]|nr:hypothetical protein [Candidatus Peribacteraceae bacterium]
MLKVVSTGVRFLAFAGLVSGAMWMSLQSVEQSKLSATISSTASPVDECWISGTAPDPGTMACPSGTVGYDDGTGIIVCCEAPYTVPTGSTGCYVPGGYPCNSPDGEAPFLGQCFAGACLLEGKDPEGGVEMTLCLLGEDQFGNCIPCACCVADQCGSCDPVLSDGGCPAETMMPASQCAACNPSSSSSSSSGYCGDGTLDPGEDCDDGGNVNEDGCSSACKIEECGDNIWQAGLGEECDLGIMNYDDYSDCTTSCESVVCEAPLPEEVLMSSDVQNSNTLVAQLLADAASEAAKVVDCSRRGGSPKSHREKPKIMCYCACEPTTTHEVIIWASLRTSVRESWCVPKCKIDEVRDRATGLFKKTFTCNPA